MDNIEKDILDIGEHISEFSVANLAFRYLQLANAYRQVADQWTNESLNYQLIEALFHLALLARKERVHPVYANMSIVEWTRTPLAHTYALLAKSIKNLHEKGQSMSKLVDHLTRNPQAFANWQIVIVPQLKSTPNTPLRQLISSIPRRLRNECKGVTLHPDLGFSSSATFNNLEQLYQWLGGRSQAYNAHNLPYLHWKIARFNKTLNIEDLRPHCAQFPASPLLKKFGINEQRN